MRRTDINAIEAAATETRHWAAVVEEQCARVSVGGTPVTEIGDVGGGKAYARFLAATRELRTALQKLPKRRRP